MVPVGPVSLNIYLVVSLQLAISNPNFHLLRDRSGSAQCGQLLGRDTQFRQYFVCMFAEQRRGATQFGWRTIETRSRSWLAHAAYVRVI